MTFLFFVFILYFYLYFDIIISGEFMKKIRAKVVNFQEYKENKKRVEVDRKELLELIKQIVTTK